ncbi:predicted protein [Naegleria gruberi]|uniref:Predicted protein n=1 Tax=Naegleria gruberi TaxID=5762 RepID=D2V7P3_NAEGR|nr:uncharacterized protein NAEGRDRAFT_47339 [Naegleria gruberi]EFC47037.1 predicted protein [Naegleria gruberi]|eukprot:XP_002679781.1 predicted protein [Naegleria gruberi strain NEG-M]
MSGIVGGVVRGCFDGTAKATTHHHTEWIHKILYLCGLIVAGLFAFSLNLAPNNFMKISSAFSLLSSPSTVGLYLLAGLFVGFGTQLGSGCTSGHMICGLARLSKRSFVATMVFCGVTMMMVLFGGSADYVSRNIVNVGVDTSLLPFVQYPTTSHALTLLSLLAMILSAYALIIMNIWNLSEPTKQKLDYYLPFMHGFVFGLGLALSGMTNPLKVLGFFDFGGNNYDPSLVCVALGAILPNLYVFNMYVVPSASRSELTCMGCKQHIPTSTVVDWKLVTGAALFGIGWGLVGVCPGPFVTNLGAFNPLFLFYGVGFIGGLALKDKIIG